MQPSAMQPQSASTPALPVALPPAPPCHLLRAQLSTEPARPKVQATIIATTGRAADRPVLSSPLPLQDHSASTPALPVALPAAPPCHLLRAQLSTEPARPTVKATMIAATGRATDRPVLSSPLQDHSASTPALPVALPPAPPSHLVRAQLSNPMAAARRTVQATFDRATGRATDKQVLSTLPSACAHASPMDAELLPAASVLPAQASDASQPAPPSQTTNDGNAAMSASESFLLATDRGEFPLIIII